MKSALILAEGRGQALHLREDANLNLLQAAYLARRFHAAGWSVALRFVLDEGQSAEEYSVLPHLAGDEVARHRRHVEFATDRRKARSEVVRELRERYLPVRLSVRHPNGTGAATPRVCEELFFTPLLAEVAEINRPLLASLRQARHPLVDTERLEDYEDLLAAHLGRPYLQLEADVARGALARALDGAGAAVDVAPLHPPPNPDPATWLEDPEARRLIAEDLAAKRRGEAVDDGLTARLVGLFPAVDEPLSGGAYFNSPTSACFEHGKVRVRPRDRAGVLLLAGSERVTLDDLAAWIEAQNAGEPRRLMALKYPYAARLAARRAAAEAAHRAAGGPVKVILIEGIQGQVNRMTGGLLDRCLADSLPAGVSYHRFQARHAARRLLPRLPGGLPLLEERLGALAPKLFHPAVDDSLFA